MKKKIKILMTLIIAIIAIFILQIKVEGKSYYIEEMDIDATILENGDLQIEQTLEYSFNGQYNGIYITIPTQYENKEDTITEISDDIYNVENVEMQSVKVIKNGNEIEYRKTNKAYNGENGVYTEENSNKEYQLKIYSPSQNENKTFQVNYILKNVCVAHKDVGELYYNFIGGEWECTIKKLTIDIWLPNNQEEVKVWGHGPDNGVSEIVDNTHVRLQVNNVATGKYVAARVVFDKSNIANTTKISEIEALDIIYEDEEQIAKISDAKQNYTKRVYIFALILIVYWIILLVKYERDKKYPIININEEELFEKYNPVLAGCFQGSRDILARDIIAVILNLIDKKCIALELKNKLDNTENYAYILHQVVDSEQNMDKIEKYVYDWLFDNRVSVDLEARLKTMPKDKIANEKFKQLNNMVQNELNRKGANEKGVPVALKIFNTILFFVSIFVVIKHIANQGLEVYNSVDVLGYLFIGALCYIPLLMVLLYIPILLLVSIRHGVTKLVNKVTGQKVVTTTITIIAIFFIILILTILFANTSNRYLIADEILICIALIIMLTDNLMLKNNVNMIEDFSRLNALKEMIENYSMMEDRDIEQITLWEKYLAYAVSFGIAKKISKRIKNLHIDDDLLVLLNNEVLNDFIVSDYHYFYMHASLDRRFMRGYQNTIARVTESVISSGGSGSGSGGGFSGGGGFSRRRWPRWRRRSLLK